MVRIKVVILMVEGAVVDIMVEVPVVIEIVRWAEVVEDQVICTQV